MEATIVIPFYNAEATLERAIDSVVSQENVSLQILLIDNNSSDRSNDIAQSYVNKHINITLHKESKQGVNFARNHGLSLAKFDWVQFLDADDKLLPKKIYNQLSIKRLETIDVICSPITEYTITGKVLNYNVSEMNDIWLSLLLGKIGWTCSNLWRTSAIRSLDGWNENYTTHEEKELMARLIIEGYKFFFYDRSECHVYEQISSLSTRDDFSLSGIKLMKFLFNYLQSNDILNSKRKQALHNQIYHKYLRAYKINPAEAKKAMVGMSLDLNVIDLPIHHKILMSVFGEERTFKILKLLSRN